MRRVPKGFKRLPILGPIVKRSVARIGGSRGPHSNEPFIHETEQQLRLAAPAVRIAVRILLDGEENALLLQVVENQIGRRLIDGGLAFERTEAGEENALFVERRDRHELVLLAEEEVLLAAAGRNGDDAGSLRFADRIPGDGG